MKDHATEAHILHIYPARHFFAQTGAMLGLLVGMVALGCTKSVEVNNSGGGAGQAGAGGSGTEDPEQVPDDTLAISGLVADQDTGAPLGKALVFAPELGQVFTNDQGQYLFLASNFPGLQAQTTLRITAEKEGYQTNWAQILVKDGHNRSVDIPLQRAAAGGSFYVLAEPATLTFDTPGSKDVSLRLDTNSDATTSCSIHVPSQAAKWLSATPLEVTLGAQPKYLTVSVDGSKLSPGEKVQADIEISGGAKVRTISVGFTAP